MLLVGAVLLLAGCLSADEDPTDGPTDVGEGTSDEAVPVEGYRLLCPQTETKRTSAACYASIGDADRSLYEPYVAVHPDRADVVAIGANSRVSTAPPGEGYEMLLFVTEDGGSSWAERQLPELKGHGWFGDPALAFDGQGRLHVSGMVGADDTSEGFNVGYAATDDLGETWATRRLVADNGTADRPWLGVGEDGTVAVVWWDLLSFNYSVGRDAGASWPGATTGTVESCEKPSRPIVSGSRILVVCSEDDAFPLYAIDLASGEASRITSFPEEGARTWHFVDGLSSSVGLVTSPSGGNRVSLRTIETADPDTSQHTRLGDAIDVNDGWEDTQVFWAEVDPHGNLHLILKENRDHPAEGEADPKGPRDVAWVVLDPAGPTLFDQRLLTDARQPSEIASQSDDVDPDPNIDHAYGVGFRGERGLLAWAADGDLRTSLLLAHGDPATSRQVATLATDRDTPTPICLEPAREAIPRTGSITGSVSHLGVQVDVEAGSPPIQVGYDPGSGLVWLPSVLGGANETFYLPVWPDQREPAQDPETWSFYQRTRLGPDDPCSAGVGAGRVEVRAFSSGLGSDDAGAGSQDPSTYAFNTLGIASTTSVASIP